MKRIGILAALALTPILVVGIGGTAQAACIPTNCAINERRLLRKVPLPLKARL